MIATKQLLSGCTEVEGFYVYSRHADGQSSLRNISFLIECRFETLGSNSVSIIDAM
jgi:hypothetical protein